MSNLRSCSTDAGGASSHKDSLGPEVFQLRLIDGIGSHYDGWKKDNVFSSKGDNQVIRGMVGPLISAKPFSRAGKKHCGPSEVSHELPPGFRRYRAV